MAEGYKDFVAGSALTASDLEQYCELQGILRFDDATARNTALSGVLTEGLMAYLKDVNTITVYTGALWSTIGPVHGTGTSYTPTVTQSGSVAFTLNYSEYFRTGRLINWRCLLTMTGAGTGANDVTISLPVSASFGSSTLCGVGYLYDSSANLRYTAYATLTSASLVKLGIQGTGALYLGSNTFTAALAAGDEIHLSVTYAASADG